MCLAGLLWAGLERFGTRVPFRYAPYQLVWVRYGSHLVVLFALAGRNRGVRQTVATRHPRIQIGRSLLMLVMPIAFVFAVRRGLSPNLVWAVTWLAVPVSVAGSAVILKERVSTGCWLATFAALAGVWLILGVPRVPLRFDIVLPLIAALAYGLYVVLTRLLDHEGLATNLFHTAFWVFAVLTVCVPFVWLPLTVHALGAMVVIGLWGFVLLLILDRAVASAPVSLTAPFILTQGIWSLAADVVLKHSRPSLLEAAGAGAILVSCASVALREFLCLRGLAQVPSPSRVNLDRTNDAGS